MREHRAGHWLLHAAHRLHHASAAILTVHVLLVLLLSASGIRITVLLVAVPTATTTGGSVVLARLVWTALVVGADTLRSIIHFDRSAANRPSIHLLQCLLRLLLRFKLDKAEAFANASHRVNDDFRLKDGRINLLECLEQDRVRHRLI